MTATKNLTREQWLVQSATIIEHNILLPAIKACGYAKPQMQYRVSVGMTISKKAIGVCYPRAASSDQHNEIFITPFLDDSARILDVLVHELIHASDDNASGHRNYFAQVARKTGLQGKLTATTASPELLEKLLDIVDVLGDIPHHKMDDQARAKPKQGTRMLKIECTDCGFNFRATKSNIERMTEFKCPCCHAPTGLAKSVVEHMGV